MTATQAPTPGPLTASDIAHVRDYWSAICDSDWHLMPADIRDDLEERLVAVGLAEWRAVTDDDLEDTFAYERGIEKGRSCLDLTALGHLAFKSEADGWMPWSGGENPIGDAAVEIKLRNGATSTETASGFPWSHDECTSYADIIAFRLAPTAPSGSERERLISVMRDHIELGEIGSCSAEIVGHEEAADAILALLSARPLALGGQQGEALTLLAELLDGPSQGAFHGINDALRAKLETIRQTLRSTTPARAEAQVDGAAGEIKPCPFCGTKAVIGRSQRAITVGCDFNDCPSRECYSAGRLEDETAVIAAWNARAHPSPTPARVRREIKAWTDTQFPKSCRVGSAKWVNGLTNRILTALKSTGGEG